MPEPIGWDKAKYSIERQKDEHGFSINFPSKALEIEFHNEPDEESGYKGKQLIDNAYYSQGGDADVFLKFGDYDGSVLTNIITTRRVDFTRVRISRSKTKVKLTKESLEDVARKRFKSKINLSRTKDLLGNDSNFDLSTIRMHSALLPKEFKGTGTEGETTSEEWNAAFNTDRLYFIVGMKTLVLDEIEKNNSIPNSLSNVNPIDDKVSYHTFEESGDVEIEINFDYTLRYDGDFRVPSDTYFFDYFLKIEDKNTQGFSFGSEVITPSGERTKKITLQQTLTFDDVNEGDNLYLFLRVIRTSIFGNMSFGFNQDDENIIRLNIRQLTRKPSSQTQGATIYRSFERAINLVGEGEIAFKSTYFDSPKTNDLAGDYGPAGRYLMPSGKGIRGIEGEIPFPLNDALKSVDDIFMTGYAFETVNNQTSFVLENREHFYQDHEIINLSSNTYEYDEAFAFADTYNEAKFGYPTNSDTKFRSIDEYNSLNEYLTTIKYVDKTYNRQSRIRAGLYDIENARRQQFITDKDSFRTDDDLFIISFLNDPQQIPIANSLTTITVNKLANTITLPDFVYDDFIKFTGYFEISGSSEVLTDGVYNVSRVKNVSLGRKELKLIENFGLTIGGIPIFTEDLQLSIPGLRSERDEPFQVINNVDSPQTIYNARLTPTRMYLNHAKWLNSCQFYKDNDSEVINTFKRDNQNFQSQFRTSEPNPLGDTDKALITENQNFKLNESQGGDGIFRPEIVKFNSDFDFETLLLISDALNGQGPTPYGYITTIDNLGNEVKFWPRMIEGNPNDNQYSIKGIKKWQN